MGSSVSYNAYQLFYNAFYGVHVIFDALRAISCTFQNLDTIFDCISPELDNLAVSCQPDITLSLLH